MAHTLRYYKEIIHADGKVIRVEFHEKNGTAAAMELGDVIQSLNLDLQDDGDIDAPIAKTMLNFTFIDAPDHAEAKTKKCGAWEEFYSPDATHWKVLLFEVIGGEKMPIWGGYITPDSFREVLTYRAGVSFIARDNIGHMQDFPFDAKGNDDGMITLMGVLTSAWAKIESPMRLNFTSSGADWLRCEDTLALDTYMNVAAFEEKNWYEVFEEVLYSYGLVLRFTGNAEVSVFPLRYLPFYGGETTTIVNPVFQTGAERELSPAVRRIEESVEYEIENDIAKPVKTSDFTGTSEKYTLQGNSVDRDGISYPITNKESGKGWCNPRESLFFNPFVYAFAYGKDEEKKYMWIACNNYQYDDNNTLLARYAEYSKYLKAENVSFFIKLGNPYALNGLGQLIQNDIIQSFYFVVIVEQNGITSYLNNNGEWGTSATKFKVDSNGDLSLPINLEGFDGEILLKVRIHQIRTTTEKYAGQRFVPVYSAGFSSNKPLLETNNVKTNFSETNNVILSRNPKIGPAFDGVAFPSFIKNGIFVKVGNLYNPARLWSWNGNDGQQMAVYNHLQLLCYHSKPNNIITGTILNADVANHAKLYRWGGVEHLLISGTLDMLTGYIENATLREFVRYEDMWGDLTDTADFPEVEGSSKTTADSGTSSQTTTYSNTTNVTIGGEGGGTIVLDTFMSDSSTNGVQNRVIKAYVDSSIANLINGAPTTLDTLKEIADAFAESQDVVEALKSAIGNKADKNDVFTKEQIDGKVDSINDSIDNLDKNKADKTTVNAIDERLKIEEGVTNTYAQWWADLMSYVKVENGNVVIDTNLLVEGESATRGTGDPSTGGGIDLNALEKYLDEYNYINEDALLEYGYATEGYVDGAITALNIGQYAKTTEVNTALSGKVDKVSGKGLSTNDFTTALLNKLNAIADGAEVNVQSDWNATSGDAFIKNKPTLGALAAKNNVAWSEVQSKPTFADVATSGAYGDLSGTPDLSVYALTDDVERLFTALNISQYAKTSDLGDLAFVDSLLTSDVSEGTNLYFTNARAVAAVLGSSAIGSTSAYPYWDGSAWQTKTLGSLAFLNSLSKSDVGLGNVANETYAGGTAVTLNGFSKAKSTASFYAPTSAGTVGYFLKSQGVGDAPIWAALGALATMDSLTYSDVGVTYDVITSLIGTTTYAPYNANGYLPLSGGTIEGGPRALMIKRAGSYLSSIGFSNSDGQLGSLGFVWENAPAFFHTDGNYYLLLHSGNYSSYALPITGGRITGNSITIGKTDNYNAAYATIAVNASTSADYGTYIRHYHSSSYKGLLITKDGAYYSDGSSNNTLVHSGNIGSQFVEGIGTPYANQDINLGKEGKVRMIYGTASNSTTLGYPRQYVSGLSVLTGYSGWQMVTYGGPTILNPYFRSMFDDGTFSDWKQIAFTDSTVAAAQKLVTSAGADVLTHNNFNIFPIGGIVMNPNAEGMTIGYNSISWHNSSNAWTKDILYVNSSGNVTIGGSDLASTNYKLYLSGRINATTGVRIGGASHTSGLYPESSIGGSTGDNNDLWLYTTKGLYIYGSSINLKNAVTMSSTLSVGGQTTINNNLIVTGDVAVA